MMAHLHIGFCRLACGMVAAIGLALASGPIAAEERCAMAVEDNPLAVERFADGVVAFQPSQEPDGGTGIAVVYHGANKQCRPLVVDDYPIEGGEPRLEASFIHSIQGQSNLFAIVSWPLDHVGLEMRGRYYGVSAYYQSGAGLALNTFVAGNAEISNGIVGTVAGREYIFEGTTEEDLISLMGSLGKWSWQAACDPSGSQMALNACAYVAQIEAEEELEAVYEELAVLFEDYPELGDEMLTRMDEAQRVWRIQLQNDLEALFPLSPGDDPSFLYGSSYPMRYAYAKAFLVRQRSEFLRAFWLGENDGSTLATNP